MPFQPAFFDTWLPRNQSIKNLALAVIIGVFDFILIIATVLLVFVFDAYLFKFLELFTGSSEKSFLLDSIVVSGLNLFVSGLLFWAILRSKSLTFFKTVLLAVPTSLLLLSFAGFLKAPWWMVLIFSPLFYWFYHTKQSWVYYYSVIFSVLSFTAFFAFAFASICGSGGC